jgi:hypothetical protein
MRRTAIIGAAVLVSSLTLFAASPAFADDDSDSPTQGGASLTIRNPNAGGITPQATVIMDGTLAATGTTKFKPTGGSTGTATVKFSTHADWGSSLITSAVLKGTSSAKWSGTKPTKATSIKLYDKYWATGLGLDAVYPGTAVKLTDTTATVSTTANNTASNTHSINGLKFTGTLFTVNEQATGTYTFGSYTNTTYADN